jgi:hypothetical protein
LHELEEKRQVPSTNANPNTRLEQKCLPGSSASHQHSAVALAAVEWPPCSSSSCFPCCFSFPCT